jgi:hypothetical protein
VLRCWKMIYYFRQRERLPELMSRVQADRPNLADELNAVRKALQQMTPAQAASATLSAAAAASDPASALQPQPVVAPATSPIQPAMTPHDIVRKYAKSLATENLYFLGAIPPDRLANAYDAYAGDAKAKGENVLAFLDNSVTGNGGQGMLLTDQAIYYNETLTNSRFSVLFTNLYSVTANKDIFSKVIVLNGNAEIMMSSLSDEQLEMMRQMLAECAGLKE